VGLGEWGEGGVLGGAWGLVLGLGVEGDGGGEEEGGEEKRFHGGMNVVGETIFSWLVRRVDRNRLKPGLQYEEPEPDGLKPELRTCAGLAWAWAWALALALGEVCDGQW
jgi:hypothetical protein